MNVVHRPARSRDLQGSVAVNEKIRARTNGGSNVDQIHLPGELGQQRGQGRTSCSRQMSGVRHSGSLLEAESSRVR